MTETNKTVIFVVVALVMLLLAVLFAPSRITPDAFLDRGEPFVKE